MTNQMKASYCRHCDISYPSTTDHFYTCKGKLQLSICKECKKESSRENEKNRKPRIRIQTRDRKEYYKAYNLKRKLKKQQLNSVTI